LGEVDEGPIHRFLSPLIYPESMAIQLYHFTTRSCAPAILEHGFEGPTCWLSPSVETICGEAGRSALIAVALDIIDAELEQFARIVTEDEVWDDTTGEFVPDPEMAASYVWYEVPTAMIAAKGRIRLVSLHDRAELFSGE
jgi:hypothetical protein